MIFQKEEANGALYQMSLYSTGFVPGESKRQRGERQKQTSEAKKTKQCAGSALEGHADYGREFLRDA